MREAGEEVARLVSASAWDDFQMIETAARQVALQAAARAIERTLNADHSDRQGPSLPCSCGGGAHYAGRRRKDFVTVLGTLTLERAWYHCGSCHRGFSPRDRALGMDGTSRSPAVTRMVGITAAQASFAGSSHLLRELAGVDIPAKTLERSARALGAEVSADERDVIEPEPCEASTLYLGLDGTGVPARASETEGRQGKQEDGSAGTREAKLAVVWSADRRDSGNRPARDPGSCTYNAAIESVATSDTDREPAPFRQRALREIRRRLLHRTERQVVLGDGARWIWNFADEHLPDATQIVDIYHAREHIHDVARAVYGPDSDIGRQWAMQRCAELDGDRVGDVIRALTVHARHCGKAATETEYFRNNRERMKYAKFRAEGLCVSSGVLEGGCKTIVGARLKKGGMRWSVNGANAIIALRCSIESNRFDDFWERRASRYE